MYCVYWTEVVERREMVDGAGIITTVSKTAHRNEFGSSELVPALAFAESLRRQKREGERLSFITLQSEDPNCVGEQGVNDKLPEGYDWKKRRI